MMKILQIKAFTIIFFMLGALAIQSQIVYKDIIPDTVLDAGKGAAYYNYLLDLNNDGTKDFEIRHFRPDSTFMAVEIYCKDTNAQILIFSGNEVFQLTASDIVVKSPPSSGTWICSVFNSSNSAQFVNTGGSSDFYVGLRIKISGSWHYGWARLNTPIDFSKITIKDYAYNTKADQQILTGQKAVTGVAWNSEKNNVVQVYPNPFNSRITLGFELVESSTVQIILNDELGRKVLEFEEQLLGIGNYKYDLKISEKGVYFLKTLINGFPSTQRLLQIE